MPIDMDDYIKKIIAWAEPQILGSLEELEKACPSYVVLKMRGYGDRLRVNSIKDIEDINLLYRQCKVFNKTGKKYEIDHIIPLFKGGTHSVDNLRMLTFEDHRKKSGDERKKKKVTDAD